MFKYLHPDRVDILLNLEIRFTQPILFNDPFESLPAIERIMSDEGFDKFINSEITTNISNMSWNDVDIETILQKAGFSPQKQTVESIKKLPFDKVLEEILAPFLTQLKSTLTGQNKDAMIEVSKRLQTNWSQLFGVLCLSETWNNLVMWSHYADLHRGFVMEFDTDNQFFDTRISETDQIRCLRKVLYVDQRPKLTIYNPPIDDEQFGIYIINNILLTKSTHWKDEMEWRIVKPLENASRRVAGEKDAEIYLFSIDPKCIRSVILGCRMLPEAKELIRSALGDNKELRHVRVLQATLDYNNYRIAASIE